ncbi:hypothetical protein [Aeromonas media]|uniref:hypothetical protein n=1 Tax=Aeromonas media TaxID=651 RepID=UPI003D1CA186
MDAHADEPIIRNVRVRQGETIKLSNDGAILQEITCDDIARLALAMHDHSYFFALRRGLRIRFSRDLNGSGIQGLYITKENNETNSPNLIQVIFDYTYGENGEFLYEADLIMDQGKDYEPTVNKGKHRFVAKWVELEIDWNSGEIQQWRSDIERLSRSPDTLTGWIEDDLEMLVSCSGYSCRKPAILTINELKQHVASGLSLEDLKTRLKCSKCGKRGARVTVF